MQLAIEAYAIIAKTSDIFRYNLIRQIIISIIRWLWECTLYHSHYPQFLGRAFIIGQVQINSYIYYLNLIISPIGYLFYDLVPILSITFNFATSGSSYALHSLR